MESVLVNVKKKSFLKEIKQLKNKKLKQSIYNCIREIELAENIYKEFP